MRLFTVSLMLASVLMLLPKSQPLPVSAPIEATIMLSHGGEVHPISVEEYVVGVVASEMPYTFHEEALKAQAVAARTYLYYLLNDTARRHADADICSDAAHCCGYATEDMLAERYGKKYAAEAMSAAYKAVHETCGEILTFGDAPILSVWHSSSERVTENCESVWVSALPYLVSVSSPEDARAEIVSYSESEALSRLVSSGFICNRISGVTVKRTSTGRCDSLTIGGATLTGNDVRRVFGLKSTDITVFFVGGRLIFSVRGYGHGVGMSQYGAETMAQSGASYSEILTHYYSGAVLVRADQSVHS